MKDERSIPTSLQIVAGLFLLGGLCGVAEIVVRLIAGSIHINLGFLGILAYFGLRRYSVGWLIFALVCIWLELIGLPIAFVFGIFSKAPVSVEYFGFRFAQLDPIWISAISVPLFLLEFWQYRVLTHPRVQALFFAAPNATDVA